nr:hypothetical protein [uncultured bacterium]
MQFEPADLFSRQSNFEVRLKNNHSIGILALACASFFGLGVITAAIGPSLPDLAGNTASTLSGVGGLFTGLFLGSLGAQILNGLLLDRLGPRWIILIGLTITAVGILGVSLSNSLPLALACATFAGLGHGTINLVMNVSISNLFPDRRASVLNLLNVFYGIGAFIAPAVAGLALRLSNSSLPALWAGAGIELLLLPLFLWLFHIPAAKQTTPKERNGRSLLSSPALWLLGVMLLIYVGLENGAGGWVSTYLQQTTPLTAASAALGASCFWLALTAGRVVGSFLGARWQARTLLTVSLLVALGGGLTILASTGSPVFSILGFVLLGFGFGPVFPTTLAIITAIFSAVPGAAASIGTSMGSVGGMLIPWLQGVVLENNGPHAGALLLPLGSFLMLTCLAAVRRARRREAIAYATSAGMSGDKKD